MVIECNALGVLYIMGSLITADDIQHADGFGDGGCNSGKTKHSSQFLLYICYLPQGQHFVGKSQQRTVQENKLVGLLGNYWNKRVLYFFFQHLLRRWEQECWLFWLGEEEGPTSYHAEDHNYHNWWVFFFYYFANITINYFSPASDGGGDDDDSDEDDDLLLSARARSNRQLSSQRRAQQKSKTTKRPSKAKILQSWQTEIKNGLQIIILCFFF